MCEQYNRFHHATAHKHRAEFWLQVQNYTSVVKYEGWNFNSGNYLFTTDTK